ncbi:MAG: TldD/PmbA family protein [Bacteroidales bacterium]|nr:TldD/PmbA family protein [Bacteroidales bacterium]
MISNSDKSIAAWALEQCKKGGADAARISIYGGTGSSYELRDLNIDKLQQASERSMIIHLFVNGRYGSYSTNRTDKKELESFIKNGIQNTRYLAEDPYRTLPDTSRYYKGKDKNLKLCDSGFDRITPETKIELARAIGEEIHKKDPRILSHSTAFSDTLEFSYQIDSQGFEGENATTQFTLSASVSIKDDDDSRPEDYWYDASLYFDSLQKQGIGKKALERVTRKTGAKKIPSGKYPMIVDCLSSSRLVSPLISALYGSALQQRNSFLLDKKGEQLFSTNMTLTDNPHCESTPGARLFDGEGVATKKRKIIENGILRDYFIDTYNANKMKIEPTISSPSTLFLNQGNKDLNGLIKTISKGVLITGFNGGNCNSTTGDFSYGIEGFLIENGIVTQPVSEMNITGNMISLWRTLIETGNDPLISSSWRIPSLVFEQVDFSGL